MLVLGLLIFGYVTLLYGILKLVVCCLDLYLSIEERAALFLKYPLLKRVLTFDVSTAGKTLSLVYVVFAVLTILRAVERLWTGTIHEDVKNVFQSRLFIYLLYGIMGVFLVVMYYLVLYTNVDIEKDIKYKKRYELLGICGGLLFITSVPIFFMLHMVFDHGIWYALKKYYVVTVLTVLIIILCLMMFLYYTHSIIVREVSDYSRFSTFQEVLTLLVIPTIVF
jgi:hypothetical protein